MRFGVLGPLEVTTDAGAPVDVGGRQPRSLLAALVGAGGRPVSVASLIATIWGENPPASATSTLHSYISRLRRVLDAAGVSQLVLDDGGYRLDLSHHTVAVERFEELAAQGHAHLAALRFEQADEALGSALALWRAFASGDRERAAERLLSAIATGQEHDEHALARRAGAVAADLPLDLPAGPRRASRT
jgi:DNA-binding SARP family transcriptional activator